MVTLDASCKYYKCRHVIQGVPNNVDFKVYQHGGGCHMIDTNGPVVAINEDKVLVLYLFELWSPNDIETPLYMLILAKVQQFESHSKMLDY